MTTTTGPRRPPGRYDAPRSLPRAVQVTGAVVLLGLLVAASWAAYERFAGDRVQYGTRGYEVVGDTEVQVRFEVQKGVLDTARCTLTARDADSAVVGSEQVDVGPSDREAVITTSSVTTSRRAATAEATRCVLVTP